MYKYVYMYKYVSMYICIYVYICYRYTAIPLHSPVRA